jgi:hypothetical protein
MEATLLLPQELGKMVFSSPSKGACNECFLSHSSSLQPHLSSWTENAANNFLHPEKACFSVLFRTRELHTLFSLFWKNGLSTHLLRNPLFPQISFFSFLPQQDCVGLNPQFVVRSGSLSDGYSSHLLINS